MSTKTSPFPSHISLQHEQLLQSANECLDDVGEFVDKLRRRAQNIHRRNTWK